MTKHSPDAAGAVAGQSPDYRASYRLDLGRNSGGIAVVAAPPGATKLSDHGISATRFFSSSSALSSPTLNDPAVGGHGIEYNSCGPLSFLLRPTASMP